MNAATAPKTITYVVLRKHAGRWAPRTWGVDASSDEYRRLIAAGWLPEKGWTATETAPGVWSLAGRLLDLPVRQYPANVVY